jgi:hypothetical protein
MEEITLDSYAKYIKDQELKGIVLKLKNELRKPDAAWDTVKPLLRTIYEKDEKVFSEIAVLLVK